MFTTAELESFYSCFRGFKYTYITKEISNYTGLTQAERAQLKEFIKKKTHDKYGIEKGRNFRRTHPNYYREYMRNYRQIIKNKGLPELFPCFVFTKVAPVKGVKVTKQPEITGDPFIQLNLF